MLGTVAQFRTGDSTSPEALNSGYGLGLSVAAILLLGSVLIAVVVLPRAKPAAQQQAPAEADHDTAAQPQPVTD